MTRFMKPLVSNIQLYTAQMERLPIVVFVENELVGSGLIEGISDIAVKVRGKYHLRAMCTFKYAS
jgi:hypothetical protein